MKKFYQGIEQKKEIEHWQDTQNRKHHDTLLPGQKSPIPLDRYDDFGTKQIETPNSTLNKNQYKWIARALYNFQVLFYFNELLKILFYHVSYCFIFFSK